MKSFQVAGACWCIWISFEGGLSVDIRELQKARAFTVNLRGCHPLCSFVHHDAHLGNNKRLCMSGIPRHYACLDYQLAVHVWNTNTLACRQGVGARKGSATEPRLGQGAFVSFAAHGLVACLSTCSVNIPVHLSKLCGKCMFRFRTVACPLVSTCVRCPHPPLVLRPENAHDPAIPAAPMPGRGVLLCVSICSWACACVLSSRS